MNLSEHDPLGIHYLKFFLTFTALFVHALVFSSMATQARVDLTDPTLLHLLALIPSSILIPMAAGAVQAVSLKDKFRDGRLQDFNLLPLIQISFVLAFVESFKAAIVYAPGVFFGWNVLHFLAIAIVTVLFLARISIYAVGASSLLCLALTAPLKSLLRLFQIQTPEQALSIDELGGGQLARLLICITVFVIAMWLIYSRPAIAKKFKHRMALAALIVLNIALYFALAYPGDPYFAARLINLPTGALVGDKLGLHYWPFFPWYSGVAIGFTFYYFLMNASRPKLFRKIALTCACIGLLIHFTLLEGGVARNFDPYTVWSSALFNDRINVMVFTTSSFLLFALLFERLSLSKSWQRICDRYPLLWRVPFVYSKTILWAYLFVNTFGVWIGKAAGAYLPSYGWRIAFAFAVSIVWYWLGEFTLKWMSRMKITVRFSPAR